MCPLKCGDLGFYIRCIRRSFETDVRNRELLKILEIQRYKIQNRSALLSIKSPLGPICSNSHKVQNSLMYSSSKFTPNLSLCK